MLEEIFRGNPDKLLSWEEFLAYWEWDPESWNTEIKEERYSDEMEFKYNMDRDDDGKLDYEEFVRSQEDTRNTRWQFKDFDEDRDGKLSYPEFRHIKEYWRQRRIG